MKQFKVALQLYSIRDEMEKDMEAALRTVKEIGYDYVEFAGYFGHSASEVRDLLDKYNLKCISVHQTYDVFLENAAEQIEFIRTLGAKYCAVPWMGLEQHKGADRFDQTVSELKKVGSMLKAAGITLLYHNHDFEFGRFEGKFLLDWLYDSIPADILQTEIDTCWVRYAGYDPCEYLMKYQGRSPVVHLKDFVCTNLAAGPVYALVDANGEEIKDKKSREDNGFCFKPLGKGIQDFPEILAACEEVGADYVVVEQDQSPDMPSMQSAKISRDYLKSLGL